MSRNSVRDETGRHTWVRELTNTRRLRSIIRNERSRLTNRKTKSKIFIIKLVYSTTIWTTCWSVFSWLDLIDEDWTHRLFSNVKVELFFFLLIGLILNFWNLTKFFIMPMRVPISSNLRATGVTAIWEEVGIRALPNFLFRQNHSKMCALTVGRWPNYVRGTAVEKRETKRNRPSKKWNKTRNTMCLVFIGRMVFDTLRQLT